MERSIWIFLLRHPIWAASFFCANFLSDVSHRIFDGIVSRERCKQGKISLLSRHVPNNKCFPTKKSHKSYNCQSSRDLIKLRRPKRIGLVITASDTRGVEMT